MTKVLARFRLQAPLSVAQLERLAELRGVYGVLNFEWQDGQGEFAVEYDATRLRPEEVAGLLRRNGIPVLPA